MDVMLKVMHNGEAKYVGKVYTPKGRGSPVFLHEERTPSQSLIVHDSPGGIDACVLGWLRAMGVQTIWHLPYGNDDALTTSLETMLAYGERRFVDSRDRYFLPRHHWSSFARPTKIPWIEREEIVEMKFASGLRSTV